MPLPFPTFPILASRLVSEFRGDYNQMLAAVMASFAGPDEPPVITPGMLWADTGSSPPTLRIRKQDNSGWARVGLLDVDYGGCLPLSGGVMSGQLDMNGNALINLPAGAGNSPARYSDLAIYAKLDGSTAFTGIPSLPNSDPSTANQAARKSYVDARALAGGSFTGQITMATAPTVANHVARKTDLDGAITSHNHSGGAAGPKILATNLSSQGVSEGQIPEADGANGMRFTTRPRVQLLNEGVVLIDDDSVSSFVGSATADTWKTLDLSPHVPAGVAGAILAFKFGQADNDLTSIIVSSRPTGASISTARAQQEQFSVTTAAVGAMHSHVNRLGRIWVALSQNRLVDLAFHPVAADNGAVRFSMWLVGSF